MYRLDIVTHPLKLEPMIKSGSVEVLYNAPIGSIGMEQYTISTNNKSEVLSIQAQPYEIVILSDTLNNYSLDDYLEMCKLFIKLKIGEYPESMVVHQFANPRTTHIYPIIDDDYLYVCEEEKQLLYLESYTILGLYPITHDPLCWVSMQIPHPIYFEGGCIIHSRDNNASTIDLAETTLQLMEQARRKGLVAKVTGDPTNDYEAGLSHICEMRYGPVKFEYNSTRDLTYEDKVNNKKIIRETIKPKRDVKLNCLSCDSPNLIDAFRDTKLARY